MVAGSGAILVATHNGRDGKNEGLEGATSVLDSLDVHICVVQETDITETIFATKWSCHYKILAAAAEINSCGGVTLLWKTSPLYKMEEVRVSGNNIISFELETRRDQYYVMGCYIPPSKSDGSTLACISNAMK